ncbi:FAS1-like dehydratase domain-containing protein [Mycobacterium sp. 94-17]|uniref:FAS1-like dehydratase domain-containing protein n=1 Tax=Mycobacterium sp. 94-17 TaxID=2986147 RepID=UPI002D1F1FC9|nr:MaoC family dehydratase N-terminal domain-containing protein [Mycobacterium sp. 94-17]MEB4209737.1 MaoC family dehydratase N-terminal domain-containing protein [Mycobacterium sp. 94-17]
MIGTSIGGGSGTIAAREFQRWCAAVGDHNPLYFDAAVARDHGYRDIIAPPLYLQHCLDTVRFLEDLAADGTPRGADSIPLPHTPRLMAGGDSWEFHAVAYPGDRITSGIRLLDIQQKQGRSGPFLLITWRTTYTNQHEQLVAVSDETMLARP